MTDWNCALIEERLSDYLDGLLSPAEAAGFSAHAAGCEECGKLMAQVGGLVQRMRVLEPLETPPQLIANILDATLGPRVASAGWKRWFAWIPSLWQPRFAMGVATVAATVLIVLYTSGLSPAKLRKADLSPANFLRTANRQFHLTYARSAKFVNDLRVVYEIQTRLQPDAEPSPALAPEPAPQQDSQPPTVNPQEKSQTSPRPGHSQTRGGAMLAFLMNSDFSPILGRNSISNATRSPR
ncbi:MAG: zf-HC2 domain-containing protein [Candidatus Acidiferrales bacterium]